MKCQEVTAFTQGVELQGNQHRRYTKPLGIISKVTMVGILVQSGGQCDTNSLGFMPSKSVQARLWLRTSSETLTKCIYKPPSAFTIIITKSKTHSNTKLDELSIQKQRRRHQSKHFNLPVPPHTTSRHQRCLHAWCLDVESLQHLKIDPQQLPAISVVKAHLLMTMRPPASRLRGTGSLRLVLMQHRNNRLGNFNR